MRIAYGLLTLALAAGCTRPAPAGSGPVGTDPAEEMPGGGGNGGVGGSGGSGGSAPDGGAPTMPPVPEPSCTGTPPVGLAGGWRHTIASPAVVALGAPRHRGIDLITGAGQATQTIRGEIRYGLVDKALEDEAVELFACRAGSWRSLGTAITDSAGAFALALDGAERLPIGLRDVFASVVGDRSSVSFLALVAPDGAELFVSDVDGTLTSSENAFPASLVSGAEVAPHEGAPAALTAVRDRRYLPMYVTARGRYFSADTRAWLDKNGFPRGPLRLATSIITLPGDTTIDYKAGTLADVEVTGVRVTIGFGNRASDAEAYRRTGIPGAHAFLKNPEFASENADPIGRGEATGFDSYVDLLPTLSALPLAP
jgi:hypothetical protein